MPGDIESDEAALHRAIEADPADDAPWLVYADWLQDHGRDTEAAALRKLLPGVKAAVRAGHHLPSIMTLIALKEAGIPGWGLPAPKPALPPAPPLESAARTSVDGSGGWTPRPRPFWSLGIILLGVFRMWFDAARQRDPAEGDGRISKEAFAEIQRLAKGDSQPRIGNRPTSDSDRDRKSGDTRDATAGRWNPVDVAGQALRLEHDSAVLTFTFAADGSVVYRVARQGAVPLPARRRSRIDEQGGLNITAPDGKPGYLLTKERSDGDRYQVTRDGRSEVFVREKPGR